MQCRQPQGVRRCKACGHEGHHDITYAVTKAQSYGSYSRCPYHLLLPLLLLVVGPGRPSREGAAMYVGKKGDLAAKEEVSNQKNKREIRNCISRVAKGEWA
jgi:hypothetical protein